MSFAPIDELLDRLRARRVVLVVGAGVSAQTSNDPRAIWRELIDDGLEFCREWAGVDKAWVQRRRHEVEGGELIIAAQAIKDILRDPDRPHGLFAKWLFSSVAQLRVQRFDARDAAPQPSSLIDALWRLSCPVITTNYDTLIEDATGAGSVTWKNPAIVQTALEGREPRLVVHIHGIWSDADSVIFSNQDYGASIGSGEIATALKGSVYTSALLFVGCGAGIDDPTFSGLRKWLFTELRWTLRSHFLLAPDEDVDKLQESMSADPITVIGYGDDYGDLEPFIRSRLLPVVEEPALGLAIAHHPTGAVIAGGLRAAGKALRLNDGAVLFEAELRRCEEQLGCVNGLLNQIEDRLGSPPSHWPPIQKEERHRFYATSTELLSNWLTPEIDILRQTAEALRSPAADYLTAVRAASGGTNVAGTTHNMLQSVRAAAIAAREAGRRAHLLLLDREGESAVWVESSYRLAPLLDSLENTLDRFVSVLDDASIQ
jgi:hypothetical protein